MPAAPPPFKLLYNNDGTNVFNCVSPFGPVGGKFRIEAVGASVDEIAGTNVGAALFSPGLGWVPWGPSRVDPDHFAWYERQVGKPLPRESFEYFVRHGGDAVKLFVNRCHHHGIAPFVSFRLNDAHFVGKTILDAYKPRFYLEHPEYQLSPGGPQDWSIPEVRQYKLDLISELLENYSLAGIELDFLRHWWFFDTEKTTTDGRAACMRDFISKVRTVLDRTSETGQHRWLCVRVPIFLSKHDAIGIDLPAWADQCGVEMANLSASFLTHQEGDLAEIRRQIPGVAVYQECNHCTMTATLPVRERGRLDQFHYRRTTDEEFYSTAHLAYEQGADGLSLFNFVYYRQHGPDSRGPFSEPPFHVLKRLADKEWLAKQNRQYWFLGSTTNDRQIVDFQLPRSFATGESHSLTMRIFPPKRQAPRSLFCRLHTKQPGDHLAWSVKLNRVDLRRCRFTGEPFEQPYHGLIGEPAQWTGWTGSADAVRAGENEIIISLESGGPVDMVRVELALASELPKTSRTNR